jgi:hypothetical protein
MQPWVSFICAILLPVQLCFGQSTPVLDSESIKRLAPENDAFLAVAASAQPVLKKRAALKQTEMVNLLDRLAAAEKAHDTKLVSTLADQLAQINLQVEGLHTAQADLHRMQAVSTNIATQLRSSDGGDGTRGEVCNGSKCASVAPLVAIVMLLTAGLSDELKKPQPFGPNNDIMKALHSIGDFVQCIFGCR